MIDDREIREELEKSARQLDRVRMIGPQGSGYHLALAVAELHDAVTRLAYRVCGSAASPPTNAATEAKTTKEGS